MPDSEHEPIVRGFILSQMTTAHSQSIQFMSTIIGE
jgi:hypothetical protein